ncbi:uncharacterized protein LOC127079075 [Lathyrus oleraceus]|uniref:BRCT domain-containing protein n=1 Tax=Pisum sativum TaxID=3888 RepID=A0A9D5H069_PEA|nr:uncharacterized protein LOC127079075 [Pisum sativum]KAI5447422.1 hypothetical protein KIW84_015035 [Pisum sativum]
MAKHEQNRILRNDVNTEPFDDSSSHSNEEDDDKENRYFEDTVPFDDDGSDAAFETEVVNFDEETEGSDIAGETQILDDFDTQILDEGYESEGTQVLENSDDEVSVDDTQFIDSDLDSKVVATQPTSESGSDKKQTGSGSVPPRFTFIRAESLRQAALAKSNLNLKHTHDQSNPITGMNKRESFLGPSEKVGEVDEELNHGKHNVEIEGFENESMSNFARTTVRKLFNDDLPVETNGPSLSNNDFDEEDSLDKFPDYHGELERLSYVNSQEPGELSQNKALDCVDRFLNSNFMEFNEKTNYFTNMEKKSESLPCFKGLHSLSKRINDRSKAKQTEIFDWDDSCEDEGGGDIYLRRKDDFFKGETHRPRSLPGSRKVKSCRPKGVKEDEQSSLAIRRKAAAHSESKLGMHNLKIRGDNKQQVTRKLERNIANELDEQFNANCSRGEMGPNGNEDGQEMLDVGLDTQIAAEAMEALINTVEVADRVANDATRVTRSRSTYQLNNSSTGKMGPVTPMERTGKYDRKRKFDGKSDLQTSGLSKKSTKKTGQCEKGNVTRRSKNIANELDEQLNTNCTKGEMGPNGNGDGQEMLNVGLDTQIAAEAMEALFNPVEVANHVANDATCVTRSRSTYQLNNFSTGKMGPVTPKEHTGLSKKRTKKSEQHEKGNVMSRSKKSKLNAEGNQTSGADKIGRIVSPPIGEQRKSAEALKRHHLDELKNLESNDGGSTVDRNRVQDEVFHCTPIARRTRRSLAAREGPTGIDPHEKSTGVRLPQPEGLGPKSTPGSSDHFAVDDTTELCQQEKFASKENVVSVSNGVSVDTLDYPRRRRSLRITRFSNHGEGSESLVGSSKSFKQSGDIGKGSSKSSEPTEDIGKSTAQKRKARTHSGVKSHVNNYSPSSSRGGLVAPSDDQMQRKTLESNLNSNVKNNADVLLSTKNLEVTISDESLRDGYKSPDMATTSPANCKTPVNDASPVCMGDDYYKQSCKRKYSRACDLKVYRVDLRKELSSLNAIRPELITPSKDSRKRKDMADVRILYSHHLDGDIIKHQKKILARLGVFVASSIADATHFITDQFVRTRNMLEAIAFGKPVVTHLWIESCGQANCFIDERNYILRDDKKEKEFGFSMPVSLARATQHPLLEGRRVFVTSNIKPSKEIISSLVTAVHGQAVERVGRSAMKDHKIPDDLLILSCEEDYASCVPFLEKGAMVYSSELLLNGIVTQKLEYERHRLFAEHVKKTRSTIWLKRDDRKFTPVTKCN